MCVFSDDFRPLSNTRPPSWWPCLKEDFVKHRIPLVWQTSLGWESKQALKVNYWPTYFFYLYKGIVSQYHSLGIKSPHRPWWFSALACLCTLRCNLLKTKEKTISFILTLPTLFFCKKEKLDLMSTLSQRHRFVPLASCSTSMAGISDFMYDATFYADSGALAESHTVGHKFTSVTVMDKLVEVAFKAV